jgi:hypothetical protein
MGQTGLVALKKSSVAGLRINYPLIEHDDDSKLERQDLNSFNSGGIAEARRPVWPAATNQTKRRRKPNPKNRKPSGIVRDEDDEEDHHQQHYYHKKKQSSGSGLPWFFNLMGPPGKSPN